MGPLKLISKPKHSTLLLMNVSARAFGLCEGTVNFKNQILLYTTSFLLLYYFIAKYFDSSRPFSDRTGTVSEAKFYVISQLKIYEIVLKRVH